MTDGHSSPESPQIIAVIPGDGIGKDVTAEAMKVLAAATSRFDLPIETESFDWDADRYLDTGETLPEGMLERFAEDYAAIFIGAFGDPRVPDMKHAADILLGIRFGLDLYVNLRPIRLYDERLCPLKDKTAEDINMVILRENTEGAYVGIGGQFKRDQPEEVAVQEEIHTRKGVDRILEAAFEYASTHGHRKVLMADKSNVMQYGHDLWQRCFAEIQERYPEIEASHMYVDALTMQMVRKPEQFEVIVTNNMFGDIITDLGAALQGGLGLAGSANLHPGRTSMFEPVHGSAPKYARTGRANPAAAIVTIALMLDHLGYGEASTAVEGAVAESIQARRCTADIGGDLSTQAFGDLIAETVAG